MAESSYASFLASKAATAPITGIPDIGALPHFMKDHQRDLTRWALRRGRSAIFAATGLGKTLMQIVWADRVQTYTGRPVLILTPLAVAHQSVAEAARFGINGVAYARDHASASSRIVITNYDRFDLFDINAFAGIVLDESGIMKSHDSKTRAKLIAACRETPFKLACTATPAPNDWIELGGHSEFLGIMTEKEMLATYFVHDGSVRAHGESEWRLKSHAVDAFWRWVASWGAMIRSPADLGYDDAEYRLPPLIKRQVTVRSDHDLASGFLFAMEANTLQERLAARRSTVERRAAAAAAIINAGPDRPWLVWCNLNAEADALRRLIPDAVEVRGTDDPDLKTKRLLGFCHGDPRIIITKPSVAGWGLNWQHCHDMVFVGLNDSFEQVFQAIRRCWRFGQKHPVSVTMIAADIEGAVVANLDAKERAFDAMGEAMAVHMADLVQQQVHGALPDRMFDSAAVSMEFPAWL